MKESSSIAIERSGIDSSVLPAAKKSFAEHKSEIIIRAIIWGFVGAIFGGLYIGFTSMMAPLAMNSLVVIPAAAFAGAVGAAFYGSFQVAIIGTLSGAASGIGYQMMAENLQITEMAWIALITGIIAGYLYGNTHDAVSGALMKALTGLIAGSLAGLILWLIILSGIMPNSFLIGALLVPLTGTFYIYGIFKIISKLQCKLPLPLVGSVVAGALSLVIASSIWNVHEAVMTSYQVTSTSIEQVGFKQIMGAILGGALGGLIAGGLYAWAGVKWLGKA